MAKIAVFGGAGASGRHIVASLKEAGHDVYVIDPQATEWDRKGGHLTLQYKDVEELQHLQIDADHLLTPAEAALCKVDADLAITVTKAPHLNANLAGTIIATIPPNTPVLNLSNGVMPSMLPGNIALDSIEPIHHFSDALAQNGYPLLQGVINYTAVKNGDTLKVGKKPERDANAPAITIGDHPQKDTILSVFSHSDIAIGEKSQNASVILDKLGEMISIGFQGLAGTKFTDIGTVESGIAEYNESLTAITTQSALAELYAIRQQLGYSTGQTEEAFINANTVKMIIKGDVPGSLRPDVVAGNKTEGAAIYAALAELAGKIGLETPTLRKLGELLQQVEPEHENRITHQQMKAELENIGSLEQFHKLNIIPSKQRIV